MATRYCVGTGLFRYWTDTSIWSSSSGGAGGASYPTAADDVVIDSNSGASIFYIRCTDTGFNPISAECNNLTCSDNAKGQINMPYPGGFGTLRVYGNYSVASTALPVVDEIGNSFFLSATSGSKTIDTNGLAHGEIVIDGGATYTLLSNLTGGLADQEQRFFLLAGTLDINGKTVRVGAFISSGNVLRSVQFTGGGTMHLGAMNPDDVAGLSLSGTNWSYDAARTGTTKLVSAHYATDNIAGLSVSGGNANFGTLLVSTSNDMTDTSAVISLPAGTYVKTMQLDGSALTVHDCGIALPTSGQVTVEGIQVLSGSSKAARVHIKSATAGTKGNLDLFSAYLLKPDNLTFTDVNATHGPIFAGANAINGGNNAGVLFGKKIPGFGALL